MSWPWSQLGLPGPSGLPEIRHAYAEKLKATHPEEDPEGFQQLHSAYQLASRMARQQKRREGARIPDPQRPARPGLEPSRPPGEDFDFDKLLQESGRTPRRTREADGEDFDFDGLLRKGGGQPGFPREKEPDWDYARLFAEGEAERAEYRRRGEERRRKQQQSQRRRYIILAVACVLALVAAASWTRSRSGLNWENLLPAHDPRERVCRYIEEDLGVKVGALYNLSDSYASDAYGNVFYLESAPGNRRFLAGPDGDREKKNGRPGYTTNLPEMMMLWALEDFALARKIYNVDTVDRNLNLERWDTGGTFVFTLPAGGAGDVITGLGALLEELSREPWYQARIPVCEVVLCGRQMIEGRLILSRWRPADGAFDAEGIRELYESTFAHSYCAQLLKELELDRDFLREEGERYTLTNEGAATIRDRECYKLYGLNESGAVALEYYVDLELNNIYCLPGNFREAGNSEDQLGLYRELHWGDDFALICLFYPWLRVN